MLGIVLLTLQVTMGRRKFVLGRVRKNAEKLKQLSRKGKPGRPKKYKEVCIIYKFNCFGSEYSV